MKLKEIIWIHDQSVQKQLTNSQKNINDSDTQIDTIKLSEISETGNLESQLNLGLQVIITSSK